MVCRIELITVGQNVLKPTNNSWRENKGNYFHDLILIIMKSGEVMLWISPERLLKRLGEGCGWFFQSTFTAWKLDETLFTLGKRGKRSFSLKILGTTRFYNPLFGVWKPDGILFIVFDQLHQILIWWEMYIKEPWIVIFPVLVGKCETNSNTRVIVYVWITVIL